MEVYTNITFHPQKKEALGQMASNTKFIPFQPLLFMLVCFGLDFCTSTDTITSTQSITDPEYIVSIGKTFKLGFFSPVNNTNRYVGILYNVPVMTVVWVANREKPLNDSSGIVMMSEDGNLVILNAQKEIIWSSNVSNPLANSSAQLLDTGNLVLRENSSGRHLWESFQHPTDSFLQEMRLSTDVTTHERILLTSWKSPSDPSVGNFSLGLDPLNIPQLYVWNGRHPYMRSGPWDGQVFIGFRNMASASEYLNGLDLVDNKEGTFYATFTFANESIPTYFSLNSDGSVLGKAWSDEKEDWEVMWMEPANECSIYGKCGPFGSCNSQHSPICTCLRGFEPKYKEEWSRGNWTSGCIRKTPLKCATNDTVNEGGKEDGFLKLEKIRVPDFVEWSPAQEENCGSLCLNNCSCLAYSYHSGIGCMQWSGTLIDIEKFSIGTGADLYIRVAYSELDKERNMKAVITITTTIGSVTLAICTYFSWRWIAKRRGRKQKQEQDQIKVEELPLYSFQSMAHATNNFHSANKLGQGGFGPVYKGKLPDGQEIAVKRLSRSSGQGLKEFMNEVGVISKLQHRNLVRLIGCCVEGEEKMLIYEYMPNKSLDAFLFDSLKQELLDWSTRVNIIEGIGRGLLYLHRDSRLRIIHRDLKAGNILLDEQLNPKISDFGLAKIFGGNQDEADASKIVGTRGYMAPEYALEGTFSEKSDVYSFGVLILEIVSARRNTSFYHNEHSLSLLRFAWKLWNEDKSITLADPKISNTQFRMEILRCIQVGLLCVQEFAKDRPTVSTVLSMLRSEIADLPTPKQPAFTERQISSEAASSQQSEKRYSINSVTNTSIDGR